MRTIPSVLFAAFALGAASAASAAGQLSLGFDKLGPSISLSTSETDDYETGPLYFKDSAGKSFMAFCIEPGQDYATAANGMQSYTVGSFSGDQSKALQGLFSRHYATLGDATQQAAFQMAVWEITNETAKTFGVGQGQGVFFFDRLSQGTDAQNLGFTTLVNSYLDDAVSYQGPARYQITRLSSDNFQDLVTVTAVPEPGTYAMLLAGLGVVGFVARRRQQR
jgi:hypothetical protein